MQSGKVPDSANGSSQNNAGYYLICFETLGRSAWNSHSEEQQWHPTFCLLNNPESEHSLKMSASQLLSNDEAVYRTAPVTPGLLIREWG